MARNVCLAVGILVAGLLGCRGGAATTANGQEGGRGYPNGTCNPGLSCFSDLCVRYGTAGRGDGGPPGSSTGDASLQGGAGASAGAAGAGNAGTSGGAGTS